MAEKIIFFFYILFIKIWSSGENKKNKYKKYLYYLFYLFSQELQILINKINKINIYFIYFLFFYYVYFILEVRVEKIWLRKILGNMHLVTIWNVCWGRTVTVMENVVKHKSSRYSGRIGFNKCPEILFSEPKKGLIRTLVENSMVNSSHKSMQINSKVKNAKTKKPQKPTSQNNVKYIPSICITLNLFHIFFLQKSFAKMTLLQNIYFYLRSHWEKFCFSFMVFTFCSKGLKGHKLIQVPHANFFTFLTTFNIPSVSTIRFTEIRKSYHTSFGAFLMHFWCTFPFFYILLILQKSTKKIMQNLLDQ